MHGIAEQGRVGVRNVRHDVQRDLRELKTEGELGADEEHRAEAELQARFIRLSPVAQGALYAAATVVAFFIAPASERFIYFQF